MKAVKLTPRDTGMWWPNGDVCFGSLLLHEVADDEVDGDLLVYWRVGL